MKITFVMPRGGISGGNRVVAIYAERLARRGHDVHVVWMRARKISSARKIATFLTTRTWPRAHEQGSSYFDDVGVGQSIASEPDMIQDSDLPDADVVIATWWETAFSVAALSPEKGEKFYFIQHHEVHEHLPRHITRGTYYLPLRKITISQWLVDLMAEEYGDHAVGLVENSVDTDQFFAPPRDKGAPPRVGLLYAVTTFKGVDVSLKAIEVAKRMVPDLHVTAFGKYPIHPTLPLPQGSTYVQCPSQPLIREIYGSCDVWLCGSRQEGFHLPPLEAMACRTPVVATRVGGAMDVITNGINGWVVDVEDHEALGRRLAEVASLSSEAWRAMSDAAHARAHSYTWEDATDRFEALLGARSDPDALRHIG